MSAEQSKDARPHAVRTAFLTNALVAEGAGPQEIVEYAERAGFEALELGPTFPVGDRELALIRDHHLEIAGLIYCRNMLAEDPEVAAGHEAEVRRRIELAAAWGGRIVTVSGGILKHQGSADSYDRYEAIRRLPIASLDAFLRVYEPLVALAERKGVRLALEICPLMGNFAISPEIWEKLFARLDSPALGLTFDPSHLVWEFIDSYAALDEWHERVVHVHAKDTEILHDVLRRTGILTDFSWWRYRIPGWGELDWRRLLTSLVEYGYDGYVSVEHEDPVFSGSIARVEQGLSLGLDHLRHAFPSV